MDDVVNKLVDYSGRLTVTDKCELSDNSIHVCYHRWSPYGKMIIDKIMQSNVDKLLRVIVVILDGIDEDEQTHHLNDVSHGFGEVVIVKDGMASKVLKVHENNKLDWELLIRTETTP